MSAGTEFRERWAMGTEARALILVTSLLSAFGLATLFSASALVALQKALPPQVFFVQQLTGVAAGIVIFMIAAKVDASRLERLAWPMMVGALVLMALTLVPGIGKWHLGSRRFLLGGSVQPAELAKVAVVVWTSMMVLKQGDRMRRLSQGMPTFLATVGSLAAIALFQPDLSMAFMFVLLMGIVLFAAGVRIGHFVVLGAGAAVVVLHELQKRPYALTRIIKFLGSSDAQVDLRDQQVRSMIAVGSGGLTGTGFGQGIAQYGHVPMGMDDFIASTIGEEWGFIGLTLVTLGFGVWTWLGFRIARRATTPFLQLVAVGLTACLAITAYVHIGVVTNLLPNTGLTLPFFSNGRSNLVISYLITGILVNIGSRRERVYGALATDPLAASA